MTLSSQTQPKQSIQKIFIHPFITMQWNHLVETKRRPDKVKEYTTSNVNLPWAKTVLEANGIWRQVTPPIDGPTWRQVTPSLDNPNLKTDDNNLVPGLKNSFHWCYKLYKIGPMTQKFKGPNNFAWINSTIKSWDEIVYQKKKSQNLATKSVLRKQALYVRRTQK